MKKELCIRTIAEAYKKFDIKSSSIIHTDFGSLYTSSEYRKMLGQLQDGKLVRDIEKEKSLTF